MVCAVAGCDSPAQQKAMCWMHFGRWRRNGDPLAKGKRDHSTGVAKLQEAPDPAPLHAVRLSLEASRLAGVPFPAAWREATAAVPAEWTDALLATECGWRAAYLRTGEVFPLDALRFEPEAGKIRHSAPPVISTDARHDRPSALERVVVPWCN